MKNLKLVDTLDGGYFVFARNDYILDDGIYSELYCALFSTKSASWLGDKAFGINDVKVASRTENALSTYNSNTPTNISLIKKAVKDDTDRFMQKNPNVIIKDIAIIVFSRGAIEIKIEIEGNNDAYNFIYAKTKESLENIPYKVY